MKDIFIDLVCIPVVRLLAVPCIVLCIPAIVAYAVHEWLIEKGGGHP